MEPRFNVTVKIMVGLTLRVPGGGGFNNYRIKPKEQKKLNIPWELIKPEFTQAAMDENGEVFVFTQKEISFIATGRYWCFNDWYGGKCISISESLTIDTDGIDWKESLTQRPEGEQQ